MVDNREKFTKKKDLEKNLNDRKLINYSDSSENSFVGFGKLLYHPEKVIGVKEKKNAFPVSATVSLGNFCNHKCLWCSTAYWQKEKSNSMNFEKLKKWLTKAKKKGLKSVSYVGNGEPLAYSKFREISNASNISFEESSGTTN